VHPGPARRVGYAAAGVVLGIGLVSVFFPGTWKTLDQGITGHGSHPVAEGTRTASPQADDPASPFQPGSGLATSPTGPNGPTGKATSPGASPQPGAGGASPSPGATTPGATPTAGGGKTHTSAPATTSPTKKAGTPTQQTQAGSLSVNDGSCRHVFAAALAGSCTVTLTAVGGAVHWAVSSIANGSGRISASGGGTLSSGSSTSVRVIVHSTVLCYATGFGSGSVAFSPGGAASIGYTCW